MVLLNLQFITENQKKNDMENMDNNMEGFFKKQLNRFDEPFDDWEKPDAGDWNLIASEVPMFNQSTFWTWSNIGLVGVSTVLLTSLIYVWILKNDISVLEKRVGIQQEQIEQVQQSIQIVEQKNFEKKVIIEKENQILKPENQNNREQNEFLNIVETQQNQTVSDVPTVLEDVNKSEWKQPIFNTNSTNQLKKEIPIATGTQSINDKETIKTEIEKVDINKEIEQINQLGIINNKEKVAIQNEIINNQIGNIKATTEENIPTEIFRLPPSNFSVANQNLSFVEPNLSVYDRTNNLENQKGKKGRFINFQNISYTGFELGYEARLQAMEIASVLDLSELETKSKDNRKQESLIGLHGLTLGIPLTKNWSIQTGFRFSNAQMEFDTEASSIYDTTNEFALPDGTISKSLHVQQKTPFSFTSTAVQLLVDGNDRLTDGEEFSWDVHGEQSQRMIQIPFGLNYQFDIKKWNVLVGAGAQWNRIELGRFNYRIDFDDHDRDLQILISDAEIISEISELSYFSTYAMIGLQYQFFKNWSARATVGYNYHFLKNKEIEEWKNLDKSMTLGVYYSF